MDYYRKLYEATAFLLMFQVQMKESPFSTVVSRFTEGWPWEDSQVRAVESVAILLALERTGEPMYKDTIDELDRNIAEFVPETPEMEADLKTAKSVINWYRTTESALK